MKRLILLVAMLLIAVNALGAAFENYDLDAMMRRNETPTYIDSLVNIPGCGDGVGKDNDGQSIYVAEFVTGTLKGGGFFVCEAATARSTANGGTRIDTTAFNGWDGASIPTSVNYYDSTSGQGGAGASGNGLWKRVDLSRGYNIEWFGAVPGETSGSGDDVTDAIRATIATDNESIFAPSGFWKVNGELTFNREQNGTGTDRIGQIFYGDGQYKTVIEQQSTTAHTVRFEPFDASTQEMIFNCGLRGMTIRALAVDHTGDAVSLFQVSNFVLENIGTELYQTGIHVYGGQLNTLRSFHLTCYNNTAPIADAALLKFDAALKSDTVTYQLPFTTEVANFGLQSNAKVEQNLRLSAADGLNFTNGYISYGATRLLELESDITGVNVLSINFSNIYFDGVSATPRAVNIPNDTTTSNLSVISFDNCIFGQLTTDGFSLGDAPGSFKVTDSHFINIPGWAFNVNGNTSSTTISLTGNKVLGVGTTASTGAFRIGNLRDAIVSNNTFSGVTGAGSSSLLVQGTQTSVSATGNIIAADSGGITQSGTVTDYVEADNIYSGSVRWFKGAGTPESAVTAPVGSYYSRTDGGAGTTLYVKETGTGNTGWVAIDPTGGFTGGTVANATTFQSTVTFESTSTIEGDMNFTRPNPGTPPTGTVNRRVSFQTESAVNDDNPKWFFGLGANQPGFQVYNFDGTGNEYVFYTDKDGNALFGGTGTIGGVHNIKGRSGFPTLNVYDSSGNLDLSVEEDGDIDIPTAGATLSDSDNDTATISDIIDAANRTQATQTITRHDGGGDNIIDFYSHNYVDDVGGSETLAIPACTGGEWFYATSTGATAQVTLQTPSSSVNLVYQGTVYDDDPGLAIPIRTSLRCDCIGSTYWGCR